ncbi:hypothetical protein GCM10028801_36070 [Nocardioides maradonensis]
MVEAFRTNGSSPPRRASLTRRHFQRIADGIQYVAHDPSADPATVAKVAHEVANACSVFNPAFDRRKFLAACGVDGGVSA